jgi:hypothetical protein
MIYCSKPIQARTSRMPTPSKKKVYLYNTLEEIENAVPYAIEDDDELSSVISRFVAWARMLGMYPDVAARVGTAHIHLATDLRAALKASQENHLYPNIVLPVNKYISAKLLMVASQSIGPEIAERIEQEDQRWS